MIQKYGFALVSGCSLLHHSSDRTQPCLYSQLSLRRTPLGPVQCVRLIESQIRGVKRSRDQL